MNRENRERISAKLSESKLSLREIQESLNLPISHATIGRAKAGDKSVGDATLRSIARAIGVELEERESWKTRRSLRQECRDAGMTLEEAAAKWLAHIQKGSE